jgi:endonuclease YncB( thermonuclease family)
MRAVFPFCAALSAALAASASAQTLVGQATAIDGDSLSVGGLSVRLFGIDAPETRQKCTRDGTQWACGEEAARQLGSLIEGRQVRCRGNGTDAYGRTVAVCEASGLELNKTMVTQGWALAFRSYSADYIADESRAKAARLGIWSSTFQLPQDYRQATAPAPAPAPERTSSAQRSARGQTAVAGPIGRCAIKGNRNRKGQWIYHVPGMPYYDATRAEEFFCSEGQAQAAGYRRAIVR